VREHPDTRRRCWSHYSDLTSFSLGTRWTGL